MIYIYILKLKHGKYYIGKTNNPNIRIGNHFNKRGSTWTKRHRPVKIEQIIKTEDHFDEDKWTLKYMSQKGIHNVRGGSFCQMKIAPDMEILIKRMLNGSKDRCFKCGSTKHFAKDCNNKIYRANNKIQLDDNSDSDSSEDLLREGELVFPELENEKEPLLVLDRQKTGCPCFCVVL